MNQRTLDEFKSRIAGEVISPDSPEYDSLRNVFNGTGSPAVIVRCRSNEDVVAAIRFARNNRLTLAVRSGGHAASGLSTNDGGLVIDLSHFNIVEVLDPARRLVRVGAGAKWGKVAEALAAHGLAISSGDTNSVGVGGLTLGGGIGWLVRKYGLTIDSLEAAELVTADGRTLRVSEQEHPDLFWAIRGGGGNFGVVTSFDFRAQPLKSIVGGMIIYDLAERETVLARWAEYMRGAPEELNATAVIFPGFGSEIPPGVFIFLCYGGEDEDAANEAIQPILQFGAVQTQTIEKKPYYKMLEDAAMPPGVKTVSDNGFVKTLSNDVLAALTTNYGRAGTAIIQIRSLGGAVARVHPEATAFAHRADEAFVLAASFVPLDMPPEQADRIRQEAWRPLKPFASGAYVNFLSAVGEDSIASAYPPATYARLASIKATYDPDNVFNQNHNIKPVPALTPK
jgi:FAD/FMN-containing dehydrogenase